MSLFEWSTPARKRAYQILPIIPNEIYFHIFDYVALPTAAYLTPEQRRIFTNLSGVCRFFANFSLPRVFRFVELSGAIFRDDAPTGANNVGYKASHGSILCSQIAAKQPLALALAKAVRICHFTDWERDGTGSWVVRLLANKNIGAMSEMKNLRYLQFSNSFVDVHHWNAIATLPSLLELSFQDCLFQQGPADVEPEQSFKVKVSCLQVHRCHGPRIRQPFTSIDAPYLRTLVMDYLFFNYVDWHSLSALTELQLQNDFQRLHSRDAFTEQLHMIITQAPRSLEALKLTVRVHPDLAHDFVRNMFDDPAWESLALRSVALTVSTEQFDFEAARRDALLDLPSVLQGADRLGLESFTLSDWSVPRPPSADIRLILCDNLHPSSRLNHIGIYGTTVRLVDGEWMEVSSRMK